MRLGQKNPRTRRWARRGTRPRALNDLRTKSAYLFGAICPKRGAGAAVVMPSANTQAMQHLYWLGFNLTVGVGFRSGAGGRGAVLTPELGPRPALWRDGDTI
jgi:hypothetical protein